MNTVLIGAAAEAAALQLLLDEGYAIVERNFRCRAGELDLVARDGDILVFIEVRSRAGASFGHAAEMIDRRKQQRVTRVAAAYLALRRPVYTRARFDIVAITGGVAELIRDAWRR